MSQTSSAERIENSSADLERSRVFIVVAGDAWGGDEYLSVDDAMRADGVPVGAVIVRLFDRAELYMRDAADGWISMQATAKEVA